LSSVSRWVYTNTATVWKRGKKDHLNGGSAWGEPYQIACTWTAKTEVMRDNGGAEFVSSCQYFHEDKRPNHGDRIRQGAHFDSNPIALGGTDEIKSHTNWDMSFFGKKDKDMPDFRSAT